MIQRTRSGRWWVLSLVVLAGGASATWYAVARGTPSPPEAPAAKTAGPVAVEVATPRAGGIDRVCVQPGTVEPAESAELYAKVAGYLAEQDILVDGKKRHVDIGTRVKAGDVLARIAVPEHEKQLAQDDAEVLRADAK
ncbi:MAG TPA: hypothetical protein VM529_03245, partial [Gemmata sp.]|nr:hypothetical protein [Gemmata sp.]